MPARADPRAAAGRAGGHHGELLQGVFLDADGRPQHGLVTLPSPNAVVRAVFRPASRGAGPGITVAPTDRRKAVRAARLAAALCARRIGSPARGGHLELDGTIPVGLGMGSSTGDVIAAVRAVASAHDVVLSPPEIARLAVAAEQASDPTMFDPRPMLFAQRRGHVLEVLGETLPPVVVAGCLTGQGRPVDTLAMTTPEPAATDTGDLQAFEELRALLREAVLRDDPVLLGRVATGSARRHQCRRPLDELDLLVGLAEELGAVGVQIAHSGNVAGLLFDARDAETSRRVRRTTAALAAHDLVPTAPFAVPPPATPSRGAPLWTTTSATPSAAPISCGSTTGWSASGSRR